MQQRGGVGEIIEPSVGKTRGFLIAGCVCVLAVTLAAGLWPFAFRAKNKVYWDGSASGLHFGDPSIVVSDGTLAGIPARNGLSVEIWLQPDSNWASSTILSFYKPPTEPTLQVKQSGDDLLLTSAHGLHAKPERRNVFVDHAFRRGNAVLITVVSKEDNLSIYVNAVLKKSVSGIQLRNDDFSGTLIIANAPYGNLSWKGICRGLAFYNQALDTEAIQRHYIAWGTKEQQIGEERPYTLYLFNEAQGERIHNQGQGGPDLVVPRDYKIPEPGFLVPFWKEFTPTIAYANDLAINVFGLVPLGFCFAALFSWTNGPSRSLWYTVMLGFCVSLTIEVLQGFMPTRFSGTTDLITNTGGTAMGAWCYLNSRTQRWLRQSGLLRAKQSNSSAPG